MSSHAPVETGTSSLPTDETVASNHTLFARLSLMMLLEFIVFGSWFATLGLVLATNGLPTIIGTAFSLAAVAAIVSPMFLGAIGDRFVASQKVLGIAHLIGGVIMLFLPGVVTGGNGGAALWLIFIYMLFFMPTLGLTNTIAFRHLGSNQQLFPYIRVFGTVGWIVAGLGVGWLGLSASAGIFTVTAIASFAFGVYSFTLPATPPPAKGVKFSFGDVIGAKAFPLFRNRNFTILMACALLTAVSLGVYNTFGAAYLGALGIENVAGVLAIGQISEVVFIVVIPWVLARIGMKWALLLGFAMWGLRFVLFIAAAGGQVSWAVAAIALHGICNDFFLILAAMYINLITPIELTAQAQSLLILMISGVGGLIGSFVSGQIFDASVVPNIANGPSAWSSLWILPIVTAVVVSIVWVVFFRYRRNEDIVRIATKPVVAA